MKQQATTKLNEYYSESELIDLSKRIAAREELLRLLRDEYNTLTQRERHLLSQLKKQYAQT